VLHEPSGEYPKIMSLYQAIDEKIYDYSLMISEPLDVVLRHQHTLTQTMGPLRFSLTGHVLSKATAAAFFNLAGAVLSNMEKSALPADFTDAYDAVLETVEKKPPADLMLMLAITEIIVTMFSFYWDVNYSDEKQAEYSSLLYLVQQLLSLEQGELDVYKRSLESDADGE
jgi:hypothetical protein